MEFSTVASRGTQKVLDFGAVPISDFQTRDA